MTDRPRSWWRSRPDETALNDSALELVLPEAAELTDISPSLLAPNILPGLWSGDEITVKTVVDYFQGSTIVQVDLDGYQEPMHIPKAAQAVVEKAIGLAVERGTVWLLSDPASIFVEPIPAGVLNASAKLCIPPAIIGAAEILPENLQDAWKNGTASGLSVATALSIKAGKTLPWKTVRDVITDALKARFLELEEGSLSWPCDFPSAQLVKLRVATATSYSGTEGVRPNVLVAVADLEPSQIQDLGDIMPKLLEIKAKSNEPIRFHVRIEMGDGKKPPSDEAAKEVNFLLKEVKKEMELR